MLPQAAAPASPPGPSRAETSGGKAAQPSRSPLPTAQQRDVVLVVDDSPEALGFVSRALEDAGLTALVATDGRAALALVERVVPDLILLDALMPGLDGFDTCRALKTGPAAHVPVIFMTGLSEADDVVRGLESGGVDYVTKPLMLDTLLARIRVHLANARRAQSARVALDATGRTLLALRPDGAPLWHTPLAQRLLTAMDQDSAGPPLQQRLAAWLADPQAATQPLVCSTAEGAWRLKRLGQLSGQEILVAIEPAGPSPDNDALSCQRLAQRFALTPREAEVLLWLARGKANRDIAQILSLSPRTVNKHLEHVFIKLGVENRAAASALATQALG